MIEDFLLNIISILFPIVFYPYLFKNENNTWLNRTFVYVFFALALILTMSFPVEINQMIYDFRSLPLTIGSLYGGPVVAALLFGTASLYRYLMGVPNSFLYAVSMFSSLAVAYYIVKHFFSFGLWKRIIMAMGFCLSLRIVTLVVYALLTGNVDPLLTDNVPSTLGLIGMQCLASGLYVYFLEHLGKNIYTRQELIKSEKMKIVSDIAASVAHEIRNPLTSIRGFIQLMGNGELSAEKRAFYQKISLEELDRAQQIISDYLMLAKPDPEHMETLDMRTEIQYITNILLPYANYQNVQIRFDKLPNESVCLIGDKFKFRQALINIGKNGIEAMPDGGTLDFDVKAVGSKVVLSVRDTGIGMTPEQVNRLGTPYYSTKDRGTGLGTMVSFGIIKKMHGKIDVRSEVGRGTEYSLAFPLVKEPS